MDLTKTLEQLENDYWGEPKYSSHLVKTCHTLRKTPLKDFKAEDLRIMIGQNIGLHYLIPMAIEKLKENILSEGDFYPGDLLFSVLGCDVNYWKSNVANWKIVKELYESHKELFQEKFYKDIAKRFESFEGIMG